MTRRETDAGRRGEVTHHRLTGLDTAFLAAEQPGSPLHMMAVIVLDPSTVPGGYTFERFRDFLGERLHLVPPLRRRLVEVPGGLARPFWVEEPHVDLGLHVRRAAVPRPGGPREVAAMAAEMMARPLDRERPLWEMVAVEELAGGHVALLVKLHHATMDGLAGLTHMASLFSRSPTPEPPLPLESVPETVPGDLALLAGTLPWLSRQPLRAARAAARSLRSAVQRAGERVGERRRPPVTVAHSWLNAPITPHRTVAYTSLRLGEVKAVGQAAGATVNDVLLAAVGGALRRYLEARGTLPAEPLVAAVPLASRTEGDTRANAMTSVNVALGTDLGDAQQRLRSIRDATALARQSRGHTLGDDLAAWADVPPPFVFSLISRAYVELGLAERLPPICNLIVSSVPGPPVPLYLAGSRLVGIHPLGPVYSGLLLNVTALSGVESMNLGLVACRGRIPDLWELCDAIPESLAELAAAGGRAFRRSGEHRARGGRRAATQMTREEIDDFLETQRTLTLVTLRRDGTPVAHPLWFAKVGDAVYVNTRSDSLKVKNVERDARVCAVVEAGEHYFDLRGVRIEGRCAAIEDPDEIARVQAALAEKDRRIGSGMEDLPAWFEESRTDRLGRSDRVLLRVAMERVYSWDFSKVRDHYTKQPGS